MASPSLYCLKVLTPNSSIIAWIRSCVGPTQAPPLSIHDPSSRGTVKGRPPTRSRASSNATEWPACLTRSAAVRPAKPAPTTHTSTSVMVTMPTRKGQGRQSKTLVSGRGSPSDRQALDAVNELRQQSRWFAGHGDVGDFTSQFIEDDPDLTTSQVGPQTEMRASAAEA